LAAVVSSSLVLVAPGEARAESPTPSGYYLRVEGGIVQATGDQTTFAEIMSITPVPFSTTPVGSLRLAPDDGWSGRVEIGARFGEDWDGGVRYSRLKSVGKKASGALGALTYAYPVLGKATGYYGTASATAEVSYDVVDFEAGHHVKLGDADVRLAAGLRYADLEQGLRTQFATVVGATTFTAADDHQVEYRGLGPRLSAQFSVPVGAAGLRIGAAVGGAILGGRIERVTTRVGAPGFIGTNSTKRRKYRTAYALDAEVNLSYQWQLKQDATMSLAAGYRGEAWLGVNDTTTQASPSGARFGATDADQTFHGPFLRVDYSF
jgi:hypothetical protein